MKSYNIALLIILLLLTPLTMHADDPLKVGVYQNPPLVFMDEDESAQGLAIDILAAVAQQEGWRLEYVPCQWSRCLSLLENDEIDLLSTIAYSPERTTRFTFSNETLITDWAAVYTQPDTEIETVLDLEGRSVIALQGDIHTQAFEKTLASFDVQVELHKTDTLASVLAQVRDREMEAGVVNHIFGKQFAGNYQLTETPIIFNPIDIRYAAPKDKNQALLAAIDQSLSAWKRIPDSKYYQSLDKWIPQSEQQWHAPDWLKWGLIASGGILMLAVSGAIILRKQVALRTRELRLEITKREQKTAEIKQLNSMLATAHSISQLIVREKELQKLLQKSCNYMQSAQNYTEVWIFLSGKTSELSEETVIIQSGREEEFEDAFIQLLNHNELPACVQQILDGKKSLLRKQSANSCTFCPLTTQKPHLVLQLAYGETVYGALAISAPLSCLQDKSELTFLQEISADISFALYNLELEHQHQKTIENLRASEERFSVFMDHLPASVFIKDAQGRTIYVNQQMIERFGADAWLGKRADEFLPPEIATQMLITDRQALQADKPISSQETIPDLAGLEHNYRTIKFILPREGQEPLLGGIAWDISQQIKTERALQASESKYRLLAETAQDIICIHDREGRIQYLNPASLNFLNLKEEQAIGKSILNYIPAEQQGPVLERAWQRESGNNRRHLYELEIVNAAGETLPLEVSSSPIFQQGELTGVLIVGRDRTRQQKAIQERERLLKELQLRAEHLQQVMSAVPEGLAVLDNEQRLLFINPLARKYLTELSQLTLTNTSARPEIEKPLESLGGEPLETFLTSPLPGKRHELKFKNKVFELICRPVTLETLLQGWVLLIHDATEERAARQRSERQERLATVGQMVSGISHDFKNIMGVIVLYAQMVLNAEGLSETDQEHLITIETQAKAASELIQQLLGFSRTAGLERHPLNLVPLLQELHKVLTRTLPDNIITKLTYEEQSYQINADPTRLQQAFMNLALNARDAMPDGGKLHFSLRKITVPKRSKAPLPEMGRGVWLHIQVTDTGTGIPQEALPYIFDPFYTTKERGAGSGLGLSQVASIIRKHEGYIEVKTELGTGTTFNIYLPLLETVEITPHKLIEIDDLPLGNNETILIVEDDSIVREAMAQQLNKHLTISDPKRQRRQDRFRNSGRAS